MSEESQKMEPVKPLSKDDILGCEDMPRQKVDVPEWGGHVYVRTMTGDERDAYEEWVSRQTGEGGVGVVGVRGRVVALCVVDNAGNRIFSDADAEKLGKKSSAALQRIFDAIVKLNFMKPDEIEALAKN